MSKRLFIGNLSWGVTEQDLTTAFADFGGESVTMPKDQENRPKGFAFIDVPDDQMQRAIEQMNGKQLDDRAIVVNEARPKEMRSKDRDRYGSERSRATSRY